MIERRKHKGRYKVANEIIGQEKRNTFCTKVTLSRSQGNAQSRQKKKKKRTEILTRASEKA